MDQSSVQSSPEFYRNRFRTPVASILCAIISLNPWNSLVLSTRYSRGQWQGGRSTTTLSQKREALHLRVLGSVPLAFDIDGHGFCQTRSNTLIAMLPTDCILVLFLLGVLAFSVLVYPVAATIMLARPASDNATSLYPLGCRLWAATSIRPANVLLPPVRTTARAHVVLGLCGILLLLLRYNPATSILASNGSRPCCCVLAISLHRTLRRAAAIMLHQIPLPMVRR
jgi:hypothetical protein